MNPTTWRNHLTLARTCAVGAALASFSYLALSQAVPVWLPLVAGLVALGAHGLWLARFRSLPLFGPLTAAERAFQATVAITAGALAILAITLHVQAVAAASVCVTMLASACACRRREIGAAAAAAIGIAVLVLGGEPPLAGIPLLLLTWALGLSTLVTVAALTPAERHGLDPRLPLTGSTARRTLTQVRRPLAFSAILGLAAILINPPTAASEAAAHGGLLGARGPAVGPTYSSGPMNLNARGKLGTEMVATVPAQSPTHWRANILTDYDGRVFSPAHATPDLQVGQTAQGAVRVAGLMSNGTIPADAPTASYQVEPLSDAPVISPDRLAAVSIDPKELRLLPGSQLSAPGWAEPYTVVTAATAGATQAVDSAWLALPATVTARTRALARELTQDRSAVPQKVAAVHDYLIHNYSYDLDAPRAPDGQDAVDHFLFDSRSGFCQHFAAAQAVLLRAAGIPARVATGFAFGSPDPRGLPRRVFTQKDSHAWTEVLVPGRGWVISDATPPADTTPRTLETRIRGAYARVTQDPQRRLIAGLALLAATVISWTIALLAGRRRRRRGPSPRTPLEAAMTRLLGAMAAVGESGPPGETLREVAVRMPAAGPGLAVVERGLYSPHAVSQEESENAIQILNDEAARLEREAAQHRKRPARAF